MKKARLPAAAAAALTVGLLVACAPPQKGGTGDKTSSGVLVSQATSAADFGGMHGLVQEAKNEGALNVIALPPDWANYANIINAFRDRYGIKVNSAQPNAASQDEINAANQQKGRSSAPDVFDLGQSVALANMSMFAPYQVATFADIPDSMKDPHGVWVNDYGGYMSIGYNSAKVPEPSGVNDLLKPDYRGKVALDGDPTQAGAAFAGVMMAALSRGGSADNIAPGVDFFKRLKDAGNFLPVAPTPATIESGQTPVVIDWDYLNVAETKRLSRWKVVVPQGAVIGGYYFQAINKDGPHPAAARLWEEFLYSDQGQNLFLEGGARPVRADSMARAGTIDAAAYDALPPVSGSPLFLTPQQTEVAANYLSANWAKAIG